MSEALLFEKEISPISLSEIILKFCIWEMEKFISLQTDFSEHSFMFPSYNKIRKEICARAVISTVSCHFLYEDVV